MNRSVMLFKLYYAVESPEDLVKMHLLTLVALEWSLRFLTPRGCRCCHSAGHTLRSKGVGSHDSLTGHRPEITKGSLTYQLIFLNDQPSVVIKCRDNFPWLRKK